MDKSNPPTSARHSSSRHEKQPFLCPTPHCSAFTRVSSDVASAAPLPGCRTMGGKAVSLPPSGHAQNQRSTTMLESTVAKRRAAIDKEARAFFVGDKDAEAVIVDVNNYSGKDDNGFGIVDGHSYVGDQPKPNPEDRLDIKGEFILLFCLLQNAQRITPRQRRLISSIKPSLSTS